MQTITMLGQFLFALSIMVGLHEFGHFITARMFGMRVEKFFIGFQPKLFSFKKGDTEYGLGMIPLGGFVKISGMMDESLDTETLKQEPKPYEYRSKPAWQRLIVILGGIIVNTITGMLIFSATLFFYGEVFVPASEVAKHGIVAYDIAEEIGLKTGDKIIKVSGKDYESFADLLGSEVFLGENAKYTVVRENDTLEIEIPKSFANKLVAAKGRFIDYAFPFSVDSVLQNMPAYEAGLKKNDFVIAVDTFKIEYFHNIQDALKQRKGEEIELSVLRENDTLTLKAKVDTSGKLGFVPKSLIKTDTMNFSVAQSLMRGPGFAWSVVRDNLKGFQKMFSGEIDPRKAVGGPVSIAKMYGSVWNWERFWKLTGLISIVLAFMNLLPIPALDGGHVMFILYEMITGRKPSDKFLEISQRIGVMLLLSLMVFALFNDIFREFFGI
ncbi:MAG: RIP metalloprotease RseP [Cytophagales bacterium]